MDDVASLKDFFLERRGWFYSLLMFVTIPDLFDSYLKGGLEYIIDTGVFNMPGSSTVQLPSVLCAIANPFGRRTFK